MAEKNWYVEVIRTRTNEHVEGTPLELDYKEKAAVVGYCLLHVADMGIGIEVLRTADTATEEEEGSSQGKRLAMAAAAAARCCQHRPNVRSTSSRVVE